MPVQAEWITFTGAHGTHRAYVASIEPVAAPRPCVLVLQEIWGVEAHIQDVTRRFAAAGYVAVAPDLFAVDGARPEALDEERLAAAKKFLHAIPHSSWFSPEAREKELDALPADRREPIRETLNAQFGMLNPEGHARFADIIADTADYMRNRCDKTRGMPVASVGFCMGGALSAVLATRDPLHAGSVVFYGRPPQQGIERIACPVLGFFGGEDPNITNLIPAFAEAMKLHGKTFEYVVYPDARHAFFNDTNPTYHAAHARDAFARTLDFLLRVTK
jgi:carboxymethylenebutenolidase